jgi:5-methylcytosine-specific restriction endonuclease McrA
VKRTGIKRGTTRLARTGPLKSNGWIARGKPLKSVRPKMTPEEKYGRDTVEERATIDDEVVCEIWLRDCTWYGTDWHHRRNHGQGGPWDPANGMMACRSCHQKVTVTEPLWNTNGWWLKDGENWLTKPVLYRNQWTLLDNQGGRTVTSPPEEEAA